jgi:hypothetical protein
MVTLTGRTGSAHRDPDPSRAATRPTGARAEVETGVPETAFHEFTWCLEAVRDRRLLPEAAEAVLVVGSFATGWANPTSDYDLCVITPHPWVPTGSRLVGVPLVPSSMATVDTVLDGRRAELAYWTDGQVDQMLDKVGWKQFESDQASLKSLTEVEETLLGRFATAIPLTGSDWLDRRRRQVDSSAYRAFITTASISSADGKLEDIVGMLEIGDLDSAVLAADLAFGHMVDALLDSHGIYGSRVPKWRARRIRALASPELDYDSYWAVQTMADFDPANPREWVEKVAALCQRLSLVVEIDAP